MGERGIYYIASGKQFADEAVVSAKSVAKQMPEIDIAIATDVDIDAPHVDSVLELDDPRHDFGDQVFNLERSPFERTIFLDTDTLVTEPLDDVFELLDEFDVAAAQNQVNWSSDRIEAEVMNAVPSSFPEYNTGVVAFEKNDAVSNLVDTWQSMYWTALSHGQVHNQAAFRAALYRSDVRVATLPSEYNCLYRRPGCVNGTVKVFHGRLLETDGPGASKVVEPQEAIERLNRDVDLRIYTPVGETVDVYRPTLARRAYHSLRTRGVLATIRRSADFLSERVRNRIG